MPCTSTGREVEASVPYPNSPGYLHPWRWAAHGYFAGRCTPTEFFPSLWSPSPPFPEVWLGHLRSQAGSGKGRVAGSPGARGSRHSLLPHSPRWLLTLGLLHTVHLPSQLQPPAFTRAGRLLSILRARGHSVWASPHCPLSSCMPWQGQSSWPIPLSFLHYPQALAHQSLQVTS